MDDTNGIAERYALLSDSLDERSRRLLLGAESKVLGRGGISAVSKATGVARSVIRHGLADLAGSEPLETGRIRRSGGGRKKVTELDPTLIPDLEALLESTTRGDPESPLRWTIRSIRNLEAELKTMGHSVGHSVLSNLLHGLGYSLQANRKVTEGTSHPDRNAQFEHVNAKAKAYLLDKQPVISVDTKKKELVGQFKNAGRELRPKGDPENVRVHDFEIPELGKASPYGIYDIDKDLGWVSVGIDHDTAEFAVESIRRWWRSMGSPLYPEATKLLVTADGGGSNGSRVRLWKSELQSLADETGLSIAVCHYPPGTSKWNKIEHRLFSRITLNWRAKPLSSLEVIVNLIAATKTKTGLRVHSELDTGKYSKGTDQDFGRQNGRTQPRPRRIPWRLELRDPTQADTF